MADVTILIDPVIIVPPSDDATKKEVEKWLKNLTTWLEEALTAPFTWFHYNQATLLLSNNGQFPNFQKLKELQQKHALNISINQIARKINDFFRNYKLDIAEHLKYLEYAIDPDIGSIIIKPEQFIARLPDYLHDDLHILLADYCACKHPIGQKLHIATQVLPDSSREITVSVTILDAPPDFVRPPDNQIAQTIPLLITPNDLPLVNIIEAWAKGEQTITYAIQQQYKNKTGAILKPDAFRLGPDFIESVKKRGLDTDKTLLNSFIRAAADIIADRAKDIKGYQLHPFRWEETADSPQRTRDGDHAKAWRLMLQKHGAGWRLHYWQIPTHEGYMIEFANVCKESEREIY